MTKVKLPQNIVEELDKMKESGISNAEIISNIWMDRGSHTLNDYYSSTEKLDELVNALANGYERKSSPEEDILDYYDNALSDAHGSGCDAKYTREATKSAIEYVLDALDVKIKGINQ